MRNFGSFGIDARTTTNNIEKQIERIDFRIGELITIDAERIEEHDLVTECVAAMRR